MLRFFVNGTTSFEEEPTTTKKKRKAAYNGQYIKSYLKYRFTTTGDLDAPSPLCLICNRKFANEAMPSKHIQTNPPELKDKHLEILEWKKREHREKRLLRASIPTTVM